jgi:7-carboxy-7-deazaguanine synthase
MFGQNKILKQLARPDGALDVHSVFYTIQGEGPLAGRAAVFVRLHGCSLACSWCDTEFEAKCVTLAPAGLLHLVDACVWINAPKPVIVITGGEPMRQRLAPFIQAANARGYHVQIETAGIHWEPELEPMIGQTLDIVCSPKTPTVRSEIAAHAAAFKYIVDASEMHSPTDGLPWRAVSQRGVVSPGQLYRPPWLSERPDHVYVQPLDPPPMSDVSKEPEREVSHYANLARCVELVRAYGYRLSLQQHKIAGVE